MKVPTEIKRDLSFQKPRAREYLGHGEGINKLEKLQHDTAMSQWIFDFQRCTGQQSEVGFR